MGLAGRKKGIRVSVVISREVEGGRRRSDMKKDRLRQRSIHTRGSRPPGPG
jgi:hypothetical protein